MSVRGDEEAPPAAASLHEHNGDRRRQLTGVDEPARLHTHRPQGSADQAPPLVVAHHRQYVDVASEARGL
jgi:hypothetical protein